MNVSKFKAALDASMPKSAVWRDVITKLQQRGVPEAHMPVSGEPVEPWLEKLRGWILDGLDYQDHPRD